MRHMIMRPLDEAIEDKVGEKRKFSIVWNVSDLSREDSSSQKWYQRKEIPRLDAPFDDTYAQTFQEAAQNLADQYAQWKSKDPLAVALMSGPVLLFLVKPFDCLTEVAFRISVGDLVDFRLNVITVVGTPVLGPHEPFRSEILLDRD